MKVEGLDWVVLHELLPMKPVDTGGAITGSHDCSEYSFCSAYGARSRVWNWDVFLPFNGSRMRLLSRVIGGLISDALLTFGMAPGGVVVLVLPKSYPERILCVCKLVNEITRVAPDGEIGISRV